MKLQSQLSRTLLINDELRQSDVLSCCVFNIAQEKVSVMLIYKPWVQYLSTGILAYADDMDIIGRSKKGIKNIFTTLEAGNGFEVQR